MFDPRFFGDDRNRPAGPASLYLCEPHTQSIEDAYIYASIANVPVTLSVDRER
jgi:hypothetical protein